MGSNDRHKQHQRLKRQKKRSTLRRIESGSPLRKLAGPGEVEACYINKDWKPEGMASIVVLKRVPGGGYALGAFLLDMYCMGLKDAWGRIDISKSEFCESLELSRRQMETVAISPQLAWRLVAAGVRFARQNGFRLPPRYERWVAILGDAAACDEADLKDYGRPDGKLFYIGPIDQLRKRLVGCSVEEFMARKDVEAILTDFGPDEFEDIDGDDVGDGDDIELGDDTRLDDADDQETLAQIKSQEELESSMVDMRQNGLDAVRRWCFANSMEPHPRLGEAIDVLLEAVLQADVSSEEESDDNVIEQAQENAARLISLDSTGTEGELEEAFSQLRDYAGSFEDPAELFRSWGIEDDPT